MSFKRITRAISSSNLVVNSFGLFSRKQIEFSLEPKLGHRKVYFFITDYNNFDSKFLLNVAKNSETVSDLNEIQHF